MMNMPYFLTRYTDSWCRFCGLLLTNPNLKSNPFNECFVLAIMVLRNVIPQMDKELLCKNPKRRDTAR